MDYQVKHFSEWYGQGLDGTAPTPEQWERVLRLPPDEPLTLLNFFKFRPLARYPSDHPDAASGLSGKEAFDRYAAVSMPTLKRVGGSFLYVGPYSGILIGSEETWDLVAIGNYPNLASFQGLYADADYRQAFLHRSAACERQKVLVAGNAGRSGE